jgi:hypothetical protein
VEIRGVGGKRAFGDRPTVFVNPRHASTMSDLVKGIDMRILLQNKLLEI